MQDVVGGHYHRAIILNEAVTSSLESPEATFYLTASPYCSSTLPPDQPALSNYLFADLFVVQRQGSARAVTLDAALQRLSLPGVDWFKTDSQGIDLRLFQSLSAATRAHVLAVDMEPGLMDAYVGEDLFTSAHEALVRQGFWPSRTEVKGTVRIRRSSVERLAAIDPSVNGDYLAATVRVSPVYCEARYLRTLEYAERAVFGIREYLLLWVFAMLDEQWAFAADVGLEYERRFGNSDVAHSLVCESLAMMKQAQRRWAARRRLYPLLAAARRAGNKLLSLAQVWP